MQITCPHCYVTNRIPNERLGDKPNCGKCKLPLFSGKPMELTPDNINSLLQKNELPLVVDCWAPWCGPCQSFGPVYSQACAQLEPRARFAKLNTEAYPSLGQGWGIRSIPTLLIFKQGKEVQRLSGALPLQEFMRWLHQSGIG